MCNPVSTFLGMTTMQSINSFEEIQSKSSIDKKKAATVQYVCIGKTFWFQIILWTETISYWL